jgi:hypothetical protein
MPVRDLLWSADDGCAFCKLVLEGTSSCGLEIEKVNRIGLISSYDQYVYVYTQEDEIPLEFFRLTGMDSCAQLSATWKCNWISGKFD